MTFKNMTMRNIKIIIGAVALLALATSCLTKEGKNGISHLEAFPDRYRETRRDGGGGAPSHARYDTVVFVAAVSFPEDYDWRRDTSLGNVHGSIELYRDGERILSVPAGPGHRVSLDPDMHHLVGGHIYTEYCTESETVIGLDGKELFSYPGRELLCGLLVEDTDVYTLGQSRSGSGFSLRCNGVEIMSRKEGFIASHMTDVPEYPTGALYRDGGHMYFSYWDPFPVGNGRVWYIVDDGEETPVENVGTEGVYDIRIRNGIMYVEAVGKSAMRHWTYTDGTWDASVNIFSDGQIIVFAPSGTSGAYYMRPALLFSFRNAFLSGRHFYMGINPSEPGEGPYLWKDGETVFSPDINGYITSVEVLVERELVLPGDSP